MTARTSRASVSRATPLGAGLSLARRYILRSDKEVPCVLCSSHCFCSHRPLLRPLLIPPPSRQRHRIRRKRSPRRCVMVFATSFSRQDRVFRLGTSLLRLVSLISLRQGSSLLPTHFAISPSLPLNSIWAHCPLIPTKYASGSLMKTPTFKRYLYPALLLLSRTRRHSPFLH